MTIFLVGIALVSLGGAGGFWLARSRGQRRLRQLGQHRQVLSAEWLALEQTGRIRAVVLDARRAMRAADYSRNRKGWHS